jgi:fumarate hydratase class II
MESNRIEKDSFGEIEVATDVYWGAQTERARRNFPVSGLRFQRRFLAALGLIKGECAAENAARGLVDAKLAETIRRAALEVYEGKLDAHFPLDVYQTGSGTSTNMNANEVISNRAIEMLGGVVGSKKPVHPNDHVNAGQSSNDVIPTAIHVAAYAQQARNGLARLAAVKPRLAELALGGTAVGTGLNAPPGWADAVIARMAGRTGHPFVGAPDKFEAMGGKDAAVEASGALTAIAASFTKLANDLRWLASGPRCGIGEISLPSLQPGSSIMPGTVNPVIPEMTLMVAAQVMGNHQTIAIAGMGGNFELNVMMPVLAYHLLQSIHILTSAANLLVDRCLGGITANRERCAALVEQSLAMVTSLAPKIGYDAAAAIAKESVATGKTVRELCVEKRVLPPDELAAALDARAQTYGGIDGGGEGG